MAKITKLNCTACGAPISVPDGLDFLNCNTCGSFLAIERGEGYVALKIAEKLAQAIETSGKEMQQVIREGATVTRAELQRLQLSQEMSGLKMQLANIQAEVRALMRSTATPTIINQLASLRSTEFQVMERIRQVDIQLSTPSDSDPSAEIQFYTKEIAWINAEIQTLQQSSVSNKRQVSTQLNDQIKQLSLKIYYLKLALLKSKLPSFEIKTLPNDRQGVTDMLAKIDKDRKYLATLPRTPEATALQNDLSTRYQEVSNIWQRMEQQRIGSMMATTGYVRTDEGLSSLHEYLAILNKDIEMLKKQPFNPVIQGTLSQLTSDRKRIEKQIRNLEKKARRSAEREALSAEDKGLGCITLITSGFTAFIVGISALFSRSNSKAASQSVIAVDGQSIDVESAETITNIKPNTASNFKVTSTGCLWAFLTLLAFSILGFIAGGLLSELFHSDALILITLCAVMTLGFYMGSRIFTRRVIPGATIQGIPLLPPIWIAPKKEPREEITQVTVKIILAIITWMLTWLIGVTISVAIGAVGASVVSALVVIAFFLLGIVLPVVVYIKASVSFADRQVQE